MCRKIVFLMSCVLILSLGSVTNAGVLNGLLVWHDFSDLSDKSGNGHNGVLFGDAYVAGGLLHLDGDGDYADIGTPAGFGPVNPMVDGLYDFTIAVAYASTYTGIGEDHEHMIVSVGPEDAEPASNYPCDFSLLTENDGQSANHWWWDGVSSDQSGVGYANGSVHLVILTWDASSTNYTFYHIQGSVAVTHGGGGWATGWSGWDENLDYGIRLGSPRNAAFEDPGGDFYDYFNGEIDLFAIWDRVLDTSEMPDVLGLAGPRRAGRPRPTDGYPRVDPDNLKLIWDKDPNAAAASEHVYFDDDWDDVNDRKTVADKGIQDPNYYPVAGELNDICDLQLGQTYYWAIDETLNITPSDAPGLVWSFTIKTRTPGLPDPENGQDGVSPCPTLTWDTGYDANEHYVYWSDVFAEVNDRTIDPCVLNEPTAESLSIGPLAYDTEFFWAVDENDVYEVLHSGPLWSFMTGPDPAVAPVQRSTTNSLYALWGFDSDWGSGKTIVDTNWVIPSDPGWDPNCVDEPCDWLASYTPAGGSSRNGIADCNGPAGGPGENTIRLKHTDYAVPGQTVTVLAELIWSGENEPDVTLERLVGWGSGYNPAGGWATWLDGDNIKDSCEPDPAYSFELCDGWMYSLYQAEFDLVAPADNIHVLVDTEGDFYLDYVEVDAWWRTPLVAHDPDPCDGDVNTPLGIGKLTWRPGLYADKHDVYFGTDQDAVTDACSSVLVSDDQDPNYYPPGAGDVALDPGTTYFWKIDEVNDACDPCLWPGSVWSFTTIPFVLIDDFETYASSSELYAVWKDWHGIPEQGAEVFLEGTAQYVHGGSQSMKFKYTHSYGKPVVRRTYSTPQDFSAGGLAALWMWIYGDANNAGTLATGMYVELGDDDDGNGTVNDKAKIYYGDPRTYSSSPYDDVNDLWRKTWYEWGIALEDFNDDNNVNPHKIKTIVFGVNGGDTGQIYYDDIRLYVPKCITDYALQFGNLVDPEDGQKCLVDGFDLDAMSDDWLFSDYKVTSENYTTADANLLVEYLFEPNAAYDDLGNPWDSSGNAYHGSGINDPNIHDGVLTLDGDGNCVEIGGDFNTTTGNPFRGAIKGGGDFTIAMEFKTAVPSVLFSSSPYDPCVSDGPNNSDPSFHAMTIFMLPQEDDDPTLTYDNWHIDAATAIGTPTDGQWHLMVVTHDADGGIVEEDSDDETPGAVTGLTTMYLDGVPAGVTTMSAQPGDQGNFDPNLVDPCDHKILIGNTQHARMPWEDAPGIVSMKGDIDNVRVWDTLLTPGQVANLGTTPPAQTFSAPVNSDAELYSEEAVGQRYVNFRDKAVLANNWLEIFLWPSE